MDKLYYPAVMHPEEEGGYSVWLTDIDGCISQGETLSEAVENIKDALGLFYEDAAEGFSTLPAPSSPNGVELEKGEFIAIIEFSPGEYLKNKSTKADQFLGCPSIGTGGTAEYGFGRIKKDRRIFLIGYC